MKAQLMVKVGDRAPVPVLDFDPIQEGEHWKYPATRTDAVMLLNAALTVEVEEWRSFHEHALQPGDRCPECGEVEPEPDIEVRDEPSTAELNERAMDTARRLK